MFSALWLAYCSLFVLGHWRTRRQRSAAPTPENRVKRETSSNWGLVLQAIAICLAGGLRGPVLSEWGSIGVAVGSIAWTWWSLVTLGRQWRIEAVVTDDHELITNGPFRIVRHPIYTGLLGMLAATVLRGGVWWSIPIYLLGTMIRVRAEEKILGETFGEQFAAYRQRVRGAILPY